MWIVEEATVTEDNLTSNVLDVPPAAYNSGSTYAEGDTASVFSGPNNTMATIYESLQAANTGNTPASSPLWWKEIGTAYLAWNSGTAYILDAIVTKGARLYLATTPGTNKDPETEPNYWIDYGPTNSWAMFDSQIDTQTVRADEIVTSIDADQRFDTLALFNVDAASVNVTVLNGATEIYNEDFSMVDYSGIADYWDHFFNPVRRKDTLLVQGLPILSGLTLETTISGEGSVACGAHVFGQGEHVGNAVYGASISYSNFSKIETDRFARRTITPGAYRKRGDFDVWIERPYVDRVYRTVIQYVDKPALIIATDQYDAGIYRGLILDASISIAYPNFSVMRIQLEDF